jgi:hypothetical protein
MTLSEKIKSALETKGPMRPRELAPLVGANTTAISTALWGMAKRGAVVRVVPGLYANNPSWVPGRPGYVVTVKRLLAKNGPMRAADIIRQVPAKRAGTYGATKHKHAIETLLMNYAKRGHWLRLARGVYTL